MLTEALLDAIAFHGTENSAACFRAIPEMSDVFFQFLCYNLKVEAVEDELAPVFALCHQQPVPYEQQAPLPILLGHRQAARGRAR